MDEHDIGVAAAAGVERLTSALRHHLHVDAGPGLEQRQDMAEEAGILRRGGRGDDDRPLLGKGGAAEQDGGDGDEAAAAEHDGPSRLAIRRAGRRR